MRIAGESRPHEKASDEPAGDTNMAAKKKTTTTTTKTEALKFTKGAFYQDQKGNLWCCADGKQKKCGDFQFSVMMQKTEDGQAIGKAAEELVDGFVKQLSAAELKEYREVCQREREAKNAPATTKTGKATKPTSQPAGQPKVKKATPDTGAVSKKMSGSCLFSFSELRPL
jgi:hypothetical protein